MGRHLQQQGHQRFVGPASRHDALYVAAHLQQADRQEILDLGFDPTQALIEAVESSESPVRFVNQFGNIAGVAGVSRTDALSGSVWMLTTYHVRTYPKRFFQGAMWWLNSQTDFHLLHNIADPRNRMHLKLLHLLGFKRLGYRAVGPKSLTYVEFAKLQPCAFQIPVLQSQ